MARARLNASSLLSRARTSEKTADSLKGSVLFFVLADQSLYADTALAIEKLFNPKGDRSLWKLVRKSEQDYDQLPLTNRGTLTRTRLQQHLEVLESTLATYARLRTLRDKWLAHHDKEAFDAPGAFLARNHVPYSELVPLVESAQSILTDHYEGYGSSISPGLPNEDDFLGVLDTLLRYHDVRISCGTNRIRDTEAANQMLHYTHSRRRELQEEFPLEIGEYRRLSMSDF